jgi:hypothetical protein
VSRKKYGLAVAGEQPHALDDQAVAVMFDFVNPVAAIRHLGSRVGMQGSNKGLSMQEK